MKKKQFGTTGIEITRVGFGAWAIGGGNWSFGWGPQDDKESIDTIHRALEAGINWIDTAAVYGLGRSEQVVAEALKTWSGERPYVFTKCSLVWDEDRKISNNQSADSIRREVEDSLRRLEVETIDLYQVHWPFPEEQIEEGWRTMADLKKEGKVQHIGVSNYNVDQMERCQKIAPVETLQPPYSLIKPHVEEEILPYCDKHKMGVIVYSPMYSGMLTGKMTRERIENMPEDDWRQRDKEFQEPRLSRNLKLADLMAELAKKHDVPTPAISVAWTLRNPAVTAAIVGARRPDQVDGFIDAPDLELDQEDMERIETFLKENPKP